MTAVSGADEIALTPDLVGIVQAIVRDRLASLRVAELGVVTGLFSHESDGDKSNYECAVRLRDSGLDLPRVPVATQRVGHAAIPNVDDLVLVMFVGGDVHAPVIVGRLYNDVDRPPTAKTHEWVYVSPDDAESGVRRLHAEFPNGNSLTLDDDQAVVELADTKITIKNGGDVEIDSNARVVVKSSGDTELTSGGNLKLKASGSVLLSAGGDVTVEGMSVKVKAQTSAQLEGQATATVKGALISVAGTTSFSPA